MSFKDELQRVSGDARRRAEEEAQKASREAAEAAAHSAARQRSLEEVTTNYVLRGRDALLERDVPRQSVLRLTPSGTPERRIPNAGWRMPGKLFLTCAGELLVARGNGWRERSKPQSHRLDVFSAQDWERHGRMGFRPGEWWTEVYPNPITSESRSELSSWRDLYLRPMPPITSEEDLADPAHWLDPEQEEWCRHFVYGKHRFEGHTLRALIPLRYLVLRGVAILLEGGLNRGDLPE